jgi:glutamyl/glutaminyl-tRNA synthetase
VDISAEKIQTLKEFWPLVSFLFDGPADDPAAFAKTIGKDGGEAVLREARDALAGADPFTVENVEAALRQVVERHGTKPGRVFQPVRVAIAGTTVSPGIFESVALLGRDETLARIDRTLARASA